MSFALVYQYARPLFIGGGALFCSISALDYSVWKQRRYIESYVPLVKQSIELLQEVNPAIVTKTIGQPAELQLFDFEEKTSEDGQLVKLAFPVYGPKSEVLLCCWARRDEDAIYRSSSQDYSRHMQPWTDTRMLILDRFNLCKWVIERIELWPQGSNKGRIMGFQEAAS